MQINAYEYDRNDRLRCMARHISVAALLGDDHEERERIERELRETGRSQYGGGAAPFFVILRAISDNGAQAAPPSPPYPFCRTPHECSGKGYCPKDPACNE